MAQYTRSSLAAEYGQFRVPAVKVKLGGRDAAEELGCRIEKVMVNLMRRDMSAADIEIWDCYNMESGTLDEALKAGMSPGAKVEVEMGYGSGLTKVFDGYIEEASLDITVRDACRVRLRAGDVIGLMRGNTRSRIFRGTSHSAVFSEIMEDYSWICGSSADSTPELQEEEAWWQQGNDYDFIVDLLAGVHNPEYEFYVDRGTAYFKKMQEEDGPVISLAPGDGMEDFHITWKYLNKKIQVQGISGSHERYLGENQASGSVLWTGAGAGTEFRAIPQADTQEKADALASAIGQRHICGSRELSAAMVGLPQLIPGRIVEIKGMDSWINGNYMIAEAKHEIGEDGYKTMVKLQGAVG